MEMFLDRARELYEQTVADRRAIHSFGGVGFELRKSADYIKIRLDKLAIPYREIVPCGIVATVGSGEQTFLLRADYDALPIEEKSGLPFACKDGSCHACGHDFHSSMLLCAAQMLKEREDSIGGTVKLVFQPAEEGGGGCVSMIEAGVLSEPKVNAGMAIHVAIGTDKTDACTAHYSRGPAFAAGASVRITVKGRGGHGAQPHTALDPITAAANIITALQHVISMEVASDERAVLTFGTIKGGAARNVITDTVEFSGTCRTYTEKMSEFMGKRIREVAENVARALRVEAVVEYETAGKAVYNDPSLCDRLFPYIEAVTGKGKTSLVDYPTSYGGEDFSEITSRIPALVVKLGTGSPKEGYTFSLHHPSVVFDERALPYGAAIYAGCAWNWHAQSQH